jgi:hypothetical protein
MRSPRFLLLAGALVFSFVGSSGQAFAEDAVVTGPSFQGTFRYAGDAREDAMRRAAIDRAVDSLFFAWRPIARHRLADTTRIVPWFSISMADGRIRARGPDGLDLTTPDNGTAVPYTFRGEKCRAAQRVVGSKLVQNFAADDGVGNNEWSASEDGSMLTVKVTLSSKHLRDPIVYTLTYRRGG